MYRKMTPAQKCERLEKRRSERKAYIDSAIERADSWRKDYIDKQKEKQKEMEDARARRLEQKKAEDIAYLTALRCGLRDALRSFREAFAPVAEPTPALLVEIETHAAVLRAEADERARVAAEAEAKRAQAEADRKAKAEAHERRKREVEEKIQKARTHA